MLSNMYTHEEAGFESDAERNACYAMGYLKDVSKASDKDLAEVLRCSRPGVIRRRQGKQALSLTEIEALSAAYNVPITLFLMDPSEIRNWLAQHWNEWGGTMTLKKYFASLAA